MAGRRVAIAAGVLIVAAGAYVVLVPGDSRKLSSVPAKANAAESASPAAAGGAPPNPDSVVLTETQLKTVKVEPVTTHEFQVAREAVGSIAFNDDMATPVFTPYQGRISKLFVKPGDDVKKGQPLFEIDSPDLVQAESTMISATGTLEGAKSTLDLTSRALDRAKALIEAKALAQKDLDQATADHNAAQGAYKGALGALNGARDAVRIFGKSEAETNRIIAQHRIDSLMPVLSPITGRITARKAGPGQFVQPSGDPVYTVADISTVWMLANVAEVDVPLVRIGQAVDVKVMAYPGRVFHGTVTNIGASVDPSTHRILVRSEIPDPNQELRPAMFATFVIRTGQVFNSPAVSLGGVVREGDGTMTVWVTSDRHSFTKRTVRTGLQQDGFDQILEGLQPGELVATDGALFLSNALTTASR